MVLPVLTRASQGKLVRVLLPPPPDPAQASILYHGLFFFFDECFDNCIIMLSVLMIPTRFVQAAILGGVFGCIFVPSYECEHTDGLVFGVNWRCILEGPSTHMGRVETWAHPSVRE